MKKTASNAHIWIKCGGYVKAATDYIERYGKLRSPSADEGRMAHGVAEFALRGYLKGNASGYVILERWADKVVPVDMRIKVDRYVRYCLDCCEVGESPLTWVENKIDCTFLDDSAYTRVDFACYHPERETLMVMDFKFGHRQVEAQDNPQLIIGARALIDRLEALGHTVNIVNLMIYQPNGPMASMPLDEIVTSADAVMADSEAIKRIYHSESDDLVPGKHCRYCETRGLCTAVRRSLFEAWDVMGTYNEIPAGYPVETLENMLAEVRAFKDLLRAYETGLEALVISHLKNGVNFPHWEYSTSLSDRKWLYPDSEIIELGRSMGVELEDTKVLSPKQAEVAGMPKELIDTLVKREATGLKLRKKSLKTLKQAFE